MWLPKCLLDYRNRHAVSSEELDRRRGGREGETPQRGNFQMSEGVFFLKKDDDGTRERLMLARAWALWWQRRRAPGEVTGPAPQMARQRRAAALVGHADGVA
jgi:hypothetical protein